MSFEYLLVTGSILAVLSLVSFFGALIEGRKPRIAAIVVMISSGMLGLVFNTRREKFSNRNVRRALAMLFDFEWANENLFFGAYERTSSYWQNSSLSPLGLKASAGEMELLVLDRCIEINCYATMRLFQELSAWRMLLPLVENSPQE